MAIRFQLRNVRHRLSLPFFLPDPQVVSGLPISGSPFSMGFVTSLVRARCLSVHGIIDHVYPVCSPSPVLANFNLFLTSTYVQTSFSLMLLLACSDPFSLLLPKLRPKTFRTSNCDSEVGVSHGAEWVEERSSGVSSPLLQCTCLFYCIIHTSSIIIIIRIGY